MAKYKVLVIGLSLKNNKVAKFGDLVEESQLTSSVDELIRGNFIEEVKEVEEVITDEVLDLEVKEVEEVKPKKNSKK